MREKNVCNLMDLNFIFTDKSNLVKDGDYYCKFYEENQDEYIYRVQPYLLMPGIIIFFIDYLCNKEYIKSEIKRSDDFFAIHYCRKGRYECELENGYSIFMGPGDFAIHNMKYKVLNPYFSERKYEGISVYFDTKRMEKDLNNFFKVLGIDTFELIKYLKKIDLTLVERGNEFVEGIFDDIYKYKQNNMMESISLKIIELLFFISNKKTLHYSKNDYIPQTQRLKIKSIKDYLTENLSQHIKIKELSVRFNIKENKIQNIFKEIYGQTVYSYIKEYKMTKAAYYLRNSEFNISSIASKLGYVNSSKFSAAFKSKYGVTPSFYRKGI
ncbi:MAG: hypothetical protein PWP28_796 [Oceanotoga sp.]|uniref:helix-turn-helix domain-containing protein n=1 Tax=Oceanotoga sp. TaxID=2108366 RepID=UPI002655EC0C|nr:AraC family transcriptional regulator [Oceanotoga sp.]MDN5341921.1 hypothetical protein [Oceanotoga sp.]